MTESGVFMTGTEMPPPIERFYKIVPESIYSPLRASNIVDIFISEKVSGEFNVDAKARIAFES